MPPSPFTDRAQALADRLPVGRQYTLDNAQLRATFEVSRVTALQREAIVHALRRAGIDVLSGVDTEPLVVLKHELVVLKRPNQSEPAAVRAPAPPPAAPAVRGGPPRPWFKRKRTWVIAIVLFFLLVGVIGSATDPTQQSPTSAGETAPERTQTIAPDAAPTRAEIQSLVDDDRYAQASAAAAVLGRDDASDVARRIANRLGPSGPSRAQRWRSQRERDFSSSRSRPYPSTTMTRQARGAYRTAQAAANARFCSSSEKASYRTSGTINPGCAVYVADRRAAATRRQLEEAHREADEPRSLRTQMSRMRAHPRPPGRPQPTGAASETATATGSIANDAVGRVQRSVQPRARALIARTRTLSLSCDQSSSTASQRHARPAR